MTELEHRLRMRAINDAPTQGVRFFVLPAAGVQKLEGGEYAESYDVALAVAKRLSVQCCEPFVILELRFRATVGFAGGSPAHALGGSSRERRVGRAALAGGAPGDSPAEKSRGYSLPPHRYTPLAEHCNDPDHCPKCNPVEIGEATDGELVDETLERR